MASATQQAASSTAATSKTERRGMASSPGGLQVRETTNKEHAAGERDVIACAAVPVRIAWKHRRQSLSVSLAFFGRTVRMDSSQDASCRLVRCALCVRAASAICFCRPLVCGFSSMHDLVSARRGRSTRVCREAKTVPRLTPTAWRRRKDANKSKQRPRRVWRIHLTLQRRGRLRCDENRHSRRSASALFGRELSLAIRCLVVHRCDCGGRPLALSCVVLWSRLLG